jgi:hypothetical protein
MSLLILTPFRDEVKEYLILSTKSFILWAHDKPMQNIEKINDIKYYYLEIKTSIKISFITIILVFFSGNLEMLLFYF